MGCGSLSSTEVARGLIEAGAYSDRMAMPFADGRGELAETSAGRYATALDYVQAAAGTRMTGDASFETGFTRDGLPALQRAGGLYDVTTQATADRVKAAMGIMAGLPRPASAGWKRSPGRRPARA